MESRPVPSINPKRLPCVARRLIGVLAGGLGLGLPLLAPVTSDAEGPFRPDSVIVVGQAAAGEPWTDAATEARLDDNPKLSVVLRGRDGTGRGGLVYLADPDLESVVIGGKSVSPEQRRSLDSLLGAEVQWSIVEPHAWKRSDRPGRSGATTPFHTNVSMERATFGQWLGYDSIDYVETPVLGWYPLVQAQRLPARVRPTAPDDNYGTGCGTIRYKVEVRFEGKVFASPGAEAVDPTGIFSTVHRVSIRPDDSFTGFLSSYFLVPEVFGSAGNGAKHQTERYVGADCADVMVGALRAMGYKNVPYSNVAALPQWTRKVAGPVDIDETGTPASTVRGVARGDLIRINYGGAISGATPRSWDHVAALYEDRSDPDEAGSAVPNGQLDGFDLIVHMGHPQLIVEALQGQAPAQIDVLRWDAAKLGKRTRPAP